MLQLHEVLCGNLQPDLTILLDNDVAFSVERARRRNRKHKAGRSGQKKNETRTALSRKTGPFLDESATPIWRLLIASRTECSHLNASGTPGETHAVIMELVRKKLKM